MAINSRTFLAWTQILKSHCRSIFTTYYKNSQCRGLLITCCPLWDRSSSRCKFSKGTAHLYCAIYSLKLSYIYPNGELTFENGCPRLGLIKFKTLWVDTYIYIYIHIYIYCKIRRLVYGNTVSSVSSISWWVAWVVWVEWVVWVGERHRGYTWI